MKAEPQQEHHWLQQLVGEWTYETRSEAQPGEPPKTYTGTEVVRSLGGVWVIAEGRGQAPGIDGNVEVQTVMTLGYDPRARQFVGTWVGSMMPNMWVYSGALDDARRELRLDTEGPNFAGTGLTKYQDVITLLSDEHRTLTARMLHDDGTWRELMSVHYRRRRT